MNHKTGMPSSLKLQNGLGFRLALVLGPLPLVIVFLVQLWQQRPHYQFVPLYLAALGGLCWMNRPTELLDPVRRSFWQRCFLVAGFAVFLPAALLFSPWLGMIAWLLLLPGALLDLLSRPASQKLLPVWVISWFVVPPPFQWDVDLLQWLRSQTSQVTGVVLDALGVIHLQAGNTFEVPGQQFFVEDACSGIHSLLAIVGVALLCSVYVRLPLLASLFALLCAAGAAIALNIVRVLAVVLAFTRWGLDLSKGWPHELLGLALFGVALLFLGSVQQFWLFWFAPMNANPLVSATNTGTAIAPSQAAVEPRHAVGWLPVAATIALLLWIPQLTHGIRILAAAPAFRASLDPRQTAVAVDQQALPAELQGWKQIDYRTAQRDRHHLEGEFSRQWTYQAPWGLVKLSFDFPFEGAHPLFRCYQATGWTTSVERTVSATDAPGGFQQVALRRREFEVGALVYSLWDEQGTLIAPSGGSDRNARPRPLLVRLRDRIVPAINTAVAAPSTTYQFQALVTGEFPLGEAEQDDLLQFFLEARDRLRKQFAGDPAAPADQPAANATDS